VAAGIGWDGMHHAHAGAKAYQHSYLLTVLAKVLSARRRLSRRHECRATAVIPVPANNLKRGILVYDKNANAENEIQSEGYTIQATISTAKGPCPLPPHHQKWVGKKGCSN
jgi:hypothetical protein